ncbi:MAG: hypothetical protein PHD67_05080 [Oscillospiraceae bacterium]|nr:hypothetical protein [Oscillospiraceae bacterium]
MAWKTILSDCFTGEERVIDPRKIKILDGFEVDDTRVELVDGTVLTTKGDGKYHTLGRPEERWGEALEVKTSPDGSYSEGEIIGYVRLGHPPAPKASPKAVKTARRPDGDARGGAKPAGTKPVDTKNDGVKPSSAAPLSPSAHTPEKRAFAPHKALTPRKRGGGKGQ